MCWAVQIHYVSYSNIVACVPAVKDSVQQIQDAVIWMTELKEDMLKMKNELQQELRKVFCHNL